MLGWTNAFSLKNCPCLLYIYIYTHQFLNKKQPPKKERNQKKNTFLLLFLQRLFFFYIIPTFNVLLDQYFNWYVFLSKMLKYRKYRWCRCLPPTSLDIKMRAADPWPPCNKQLKLVKAFTDKASNYTIFEWIITKCLMGFCCFCFHQLYDNVIVPFF